MKFAVVILGALLWSVPAWAVGEAAPETHGAQAAAALSADQFAEAASMSGMFEIETSRLALERSKNARVREFAQLLITDHAKAVSKLRRIYPEGVASELDDLHKRSVDRLRAERDENFDIAYIAEQTSAHQDAVDLFTGYAAKGDHPALKAYAAEILPVLQAHLDHVKKLN